MSNSKAGGPGKDTIEITTPTGKKQVVVVPSSEFIIGRERTHALPLNDEKASKRHVQIRFSDGVYTINDLTSLNGTYFQGEKLLPGVVTIWTPDKSVRIGSHTFRLVLNQASPVEMVTYGGEDEEYEPDPLKENNSTPSMKQPKQSELLLELSQSEFETRPGIQVVVNTTLTNLSTIVAHYDLRISGLPAEWISISPSNPVQLMPVVTTKSQQTRNIAHTVQIMIKPPLSSRVRAGRFKFRLQAIKKGDPAQKIEKEARLIILPIGNVATEFEHTKAAINSSLKVVVKNNSNADKTVKIRCWDEAKELKFSYKNQTVTIPANDQKTLEFSAALQKRRWIGGVKKHLFKAKVEGADSNADLNGEFTSRGLIPSWLPPALVLTVMAIAGVAMRSYQQKLQADATATATMITATAVANATQIALATESTATKVANETSVAATQIAIQQATETAIANLTGTETWLEGDDDGDGLTNRLELEMKLNPGFKDSDGDGRDDGEELNAEVTTDPLKKDSDGDQLPDGEELRRGLNPNSRDTDGDGLADNIDPDPLHLPTSTPTPTETPNLDATKEIFAQQTREAKAATATIEMKQAIGTQTAEANQAKRDADATAAALEATRQQQIRDADAAEKARIAEEKAQAEAEEIKRQIAQQAAANAAVQTSQAATIEALRITPTPENLPLNIAAFCQRYGFADQNLLSRSDPFSWQCVGNGRSPTSLTASDFDLLCQEQYDSTYQARIVNPNDALTWGCTK